MVETEYRIGCTDVGKIEEILVVVRLAVSMVLAGLGNANMHGMVSLCMILTGVGMVLEGLSMVLTGLGLVLVGLGMILMGLSMVLARLGMVLVGLMAPAEDFPHHQHRLLLLSLNPGRQARTTNPP